MCLSVQLRITGMTRLKYLLLFLSPFFLISCSENYENEEEAALNRLSREYVKLGLFIGQYDTDFVDAYYGPDSLKPANKPEAFPKDSLLNVITRMQSRLSEILPKVTEDNQKRALWMQAQLTAFSRRIKIFTGETGTFDEESKDLFGVVAPEYPASHYQKLIDSLDLLLPGEGDVQERFQNLARRFIIPKDKLDTVFRASIAEARKRTLVHYKLPAEEKFTLEYVTNKSWSGYNWYKGNYTSTIQINTDIQIFIERAIDVGSHESYPGHHVYNMLLEQNLYRDKQWDEISLYPLFSPQSFIAEGSANYGIELAFPGDDKIRFAKEVILPLAGLDTAGSALYFKALAIRGKLNYARNEAGRGLVNGTMTEAETLVWLKKYCLYNEETALKSIAFIKKYRSYVINYNYGQDVVRKYIESDLKKQANQVADTLDMPVTANEPKANAEYWEKFSYLLSNPVTTKDLMK
jgi:hypothetical protein